MALFHTYSYKFKAQPFNEKILRSTVGVKKVTPKELTTAVTPEFHTDQRANSRPKVKDEEVR